MSAQHTPGPWTMRTTYDNGEPATIIVEPMQYEFDSVDFDESEVNARLFLAAPDLLAIAQSLSAWELDPDRYTGDLADLAHTARAAIAKATGENIVTMSDDTPFTFAPPKGDKTYKL